MAAGTGPKSSFEIHAGASSSAADASLSSEFLANVLAIKSAESQLSDNFEDPHRGVSCRIRFSLKCSELIQCRNQKHVL